MQETKVITLSLGLVNAFLLQGVRSVLVDAGYPGTDKTLMEKISQSGVSPGDISLIVITHGHSDHFGNAPALKRWTGAPVAIHKLDAQPLREGVNPPLHPTGALGHLLSVLVPPQKPGGACFLEPDILIEGEMSLEEFGVEGRIIPTPGHTPGSISILLSGGDLLVGDLIIGGMVIGTKRPQYPRVADDLGLVKESIKAVLRLSPRQIYSGHGGPLSPEEVRQRLT